MKITSKGQVTIPKYIRNKLNLKTGADVLFKEEDGRFYITKHPGDNWTPWFGAIRNKDPDNFLNSIRGYNDFER